MFFAAMGFYFATIGFFSAAGLDVAFAYNRITREITMIEKSSKVDVVLHRQGNISI